MCLASKPVAGSGAKNLVIHEEGFLGAAGDDKLVEPVVGDINGDGVQDLIMASESPDSAWWTIYIIWGGKYQI